MTAIEQENEDDHRIVDRKKDLSSWYKLGGSIGYFTASVLIARFYYH
jgi:hypothetical protein